MLMNGYVLGVLGALVLAYAVTSLARRLNVRSFSGELPPEFEGVYDWAEYRRAGEYLRAGARLEWAQRSVELVVTCAFVLFGGLGWLDGWVRGLGHSETVSGLLFVGALALAGSVLSLPFEAYSTFVVENKFGFNTTTWKVFVVDRLKGLALGAILGGALLAAILWAYASLGNWAWLVAWAVVLVFAVVMMLVGPTWLLPLFNRFTPLPDGELRQAIEAYTTSQGYELDNVFVMDGSRRSMKANAFFTGIGRRKRISLYDTLLEKLSTNEVLAVLAHEMGHAKLGHIRKNFVQVMLKIGLTLLAVQLFLSWSAIQEAFGAVSPSAYFGLTLFGLAMEPLALALGVVGNAFSRRNESQADAYAAKGPGGAQALASALKTLSLANLANLTPHPLTVWLQFSHPPILERLRRLAQLGSQGT